MDPKLVTLFYLVALACFVLAAVSRERRHARLLPAGLGLWVFPTLYVTAQLAGFLPR